MKKDIQQLQVELICQNNGAHLNGISRYTRELHKHLAPLVSVRRVEHIYPSLASQINPLRYFPIGVRPHRNGSIVHFMEDFGCSQMLWHPIRPAIATSHDLGFLAWAPEASMHRALDRILLYLSYIGLKRMDAVITVSEYSRQTIIQQLGIPAEQVFTVYSGNDSNHFRPIAHARTKLAERYGFPEDSQKQILLYVGTEFPRKNLASILQTLKLLPSNIDLLKVGDPGGERFRVQTKKMIAELELEDRVHFFDKVPDEDLPIFYNAADAYVCASFIEGFGFPILEAMACGTPVVCSNVASLPELTAGVAILVSPDDIQAFTEAVHSVLCDPALRDEMSTRGRKQAASFSWEQTASKVAEVYQLVAKNTLI
jgi:glycosyltransferase involved in cell wall biosynthesis